MSNYFKFSASKVGSSSSVAMGVFSTSTVSSYDIRGYSTDSYVKSGGSLVWFRGVCEMPARVVSSGAFLLPGRDAVVDSGVLEV